MIFTLPQQLLVLDARSVHDIPEIRVTLAATEAPYEQSVRALENALALLRELDDVGLYDPAALRVLPTAYGHVSRRPSPVGQAQSEAQ